MPILNFIDRTNQQQVELHYQTFGDIQKPALIFSNSLGTNYLMWQQQFNYFKQDYFVICYDVRGHGLSSTPQGPYSINQLGEDVIQLINYLQIPQATFCGISMGGLTGQWLAIHYGERFTNMIIANTAAKIGKTQAWLERARMVREQGLNPIALTASSRWFTPNFIQENSDIVDVLSTNLASGSADGYAYCCEALAYADIRDELLNIRIPFLIIVGQHDPITTIVDGNFIKNQISDSELVEINASHISNIEQPDDFNYIIKKLLI